MKITISQADSEVLGVGPVIPFDVERLSLKEAVLLQDVSGLTPVRLSRGLNGPPVLDDDGNEVARDMDVKALHALCWLACRRAGAEVSYDDFDLELTSVKFEDDADAPGKAPPRGSKTRSQPK